MLSRPYPYHLKEQLKYNINLLFFSPIYFISITVAGLTAHQRKILIKFVNVVGGDPRGQAKLQ